MTDQQPWGPDDELVRRALASLGEDVDAMPLAEPEAVREMGAKGEVTHLPSRRHRALGMVAGVAAAGLVAAGAGFLTWNGSTVAPPSTSSTLGENPPPPSPARSSTGQEDLVVLDARDWAGALRRPVPATLTPSTAKGACFTPSEDASWEHRVARLADGQDIGRQWVGTAQKGDGGMREAVDAAVADCDAAVQGGGELGDGSHRIWRVDSGEAGAQWWVEVRRGDQLSLLTFTERDGRRHTEQDARRLARAVLGDVDLATRTADPTSASPTSAEDGTGTEGDDDSSAPSGTTTSAAPEPTSTAAPSGTRTVPPEPSDTGRTPGSGTGTGPGSGTSSGSATSTSSPSESSSEPSESSSTSSGRPREVVLPGRHYVDAGEWASPALTGGAATYQGPVEMEGSSRFTQCTSADGEDRIGAIGIRSGPGGANYFGQQWVLVTDDAAERYSELLEGLRSGCTGGRLTPLGQNVFRAESGDLVEYIGVTRTSAGVTVLELSEAPTAPEPLTDDVALTEMGRLLGMASGR